VFLEAWSYDFFLAHAGPDAATAERLYDLLARKTRVFLDSKSIDLGEDWDRVLAEAQRRSRATVVLVSAHTDAASYQREEIATAIAPGAQGRGAAHCSPGLPATRHPPPPTCHRTDCVASRAWSSQTSFQFRRLPPGCSNSTAQWRKHSALAVAHIGDSKAHSILVREIVEAANGMERVLESLGLLLIGEAAPR